MYGGSTCFSHACLRSSTVSLESNSFAPTYIVKIKIHRPLNSQILQHCKREFRITSNQTFPHDDVMNSLFILVAPHLKVERNWKFSTI